MQLLDCSEIWIADWNWDQNKRASSPQKKGTGGTRFDAGPQPPDYSKMTVLPEKLANAEFIRERNHLTDAELSKQIKAVGILAGIAFSGFSTPLLCTI